MPAPTPPLSSTVWVPSPRRIANSPLARFTHLLNRRHAAALPIGDYQALHAWTVAHPALFWPAAAHFLHVLPQPALTPACVPLHPSSALPRLVRLAWFPRARLNFAHVVLQRQARLRPDRVALVYRPEARADDVGHRRRVSFGELEMRVLRLAAALRCEGVKKGVGVAGILANTVDAVVAMLATAAVGGVWACCSPDMGVMAVRERLSMVKARVVFWTPVYRYKGKVRGAWGGEGVEGVRRVMGGVEGVRVLVCVPGGCAAAGGEEGVSPVEVAAMTGKGVGRCVMMRQFEKEGGKGDYEMADMQHAVVMMFSSGTTGKVKCMVQGCGVLLNQLKEHVLQHEVTETSVMLFTTSTAWMLFNWLVAALGTGCTVVLYDGAALPPAEPYRVVRIAAEEKVTHLGSGAMFYEGLLNLKKTMPHSDYKTGEVPVPSLQTVFATGSPSTDAHFRFVGSFFGRHVQYVSMSGGTEINGCFALGTPWKPVVSPQLQCAGLGMDVAVFNSEGRAVVGESGELVCRNACPCMPLYFVDDPQHDRYRNTYFEQFGENVWSHGDFAVETEEGGFLITGRSDSTLNIGGVRIGTSDVYQVVESLDEVEDALVVERTVSGRSQMVLLVVLRSESKLHAALENRIRQMLRENLSPRHVPHLILQTPELPYTFSGKKCEVAVKLLLQGKAVSNREALRNPGAFKSIQSTLQSRGILDPPTAQPRRNTCAKM